MTVTQYAGPAGVVFTPDELLILWAELCRHPTVENLHMREKIKRWLEYGPPTDTNSI